MSGEPTFDPRRPAVVTLRVGDVDRALRFYHDVLGLPVKLRCDDHAELQAESFLIALVLDPSTGRRAGDSAAMGWSVDDLDRAAAELEARGIALGPPIGDASSPAGRRRTFRDPDGHPLELIEWAAAPRAPAEG